MLFELNINLTITFDHLIDEILLHIKFLHIDILQQISLLHSVYCVVANLQ